MAFPANFAKDFTREIWTLYGVGTTVIIVRLGAAARRVRSIKSLQPDDWVALQLLLWYTLLTVAFYNIVNGGGSNFMTADDIAALTPETHAARVLGSKWVLVSEQAMIFTIWSCKVMMLLVYRRLTAGLKQSRWVMAIAVWVAIGFVAIQFAYFLSCRPFNQYWAVPTYSNDQCWSYYIYSWIFGSFNVTADFFMLLIGMPLIISVQRPWQQKVPLVLVFGMGLFVIAAAITNKLFALDPAILSYDYASWYNREAAVCVYVTNLPAIWSIVREMFPSINKWGFSSGSSRGQYGQSHGANHMSTHKSIIGKEVADVVVQEVGVEKSEEKSEWLIQRTQQIIVTEENMDVDRPRLDV